MMQVYPVAQQVHMSMLNMPPMVNEVAPVLQAAPRKKAGEVKIKKPKNAYILWSGVQRRKIVAGNPKMHNSEINKRLGIEWAQLSEEEKRPFIDEAKRLRQIHITTYPEYKLKTRRKPKPTKSMKPRISYPLPYYTNYVDPSTTFEHKVPLSAYETESHSNMIADGYPLHTMPYSAAGYAASLSEPTGFASGQGVATITDQTNRINHLYRLFQPDGHQIPFSWHGVNYSPSCSPQDQQLSPVQRSIQQHTTSSSTGISFEGIPFVSSMTSTNPSDTMAYSSPLYPSQLTPPQSVSPNPYNQTPQNVYLKQENENQNSNSSNSSPSQIMDQIYYSVPQSSPMFNMEQEFHSDHSMCESTNVPCPVFAKW